MMGKEKLMGSFNLKSLCLVLGTGCLVLAPTGCKKVPITLNTAAAPPSVYAGEPVTVTATPGSVATKKNNDVEYTWSGDNVKGDGATAKVDTTSQAPGTYTVKTTVKEGKKGKEGQKPWQTADASSSYTVKPFDPPTIGCSASPATIKPGDTSTVTATGVSPQNRPLTYTYSAAAGTINGSGNTATFNSTGAPTGPVEITCNVADDKAHTASAGTSVTIVAPPPPPQPHAEALCAISFDKDTKRPTRVDNESKACLDDVALDLQKQPDAKAVLVGSADAKETAMMAKQQEAAAKHKNMKVTNFAAQRAVNAKDYLVKEKGIDASRIDVATSGDDSQKVASYLVPAGADFASDVQGARPVDESSFMAEVRKALPERHHSAKSK